MVLQNARIVVGGLSGDSGKTLLSLGLIRALGDRGVRVAPYKKGPDYIDAAWLAAAAAAPGRNLDTFLMDDAALGVSLGKSPAGAVIVVEGNRGVHDGADAAGTHSTAELAKRIGAPVVLVVDTTKVTRTIAACVRGCQVVDPDLVIGGVVLNHVASARHERTIRDAFERLGGPPVMGAIPRVASDPLPSRHLGLLTAAEHADREAAITRAAALVAGHVDLDAVLRVARSAGPTTLPDREVAAVPDARDLRIGVLRDEAFSFYYPETLEALADAGATIVERSPLRDATLPPVDLLYIGGGFPEVHVERLSANVPMRRAVCEAASAGVPVFAECGGLMYLARELRVDGTAWPMAGVVDVTVEQTRRPQGHGYVEGVVEAENPFFEVGTVLRGHEFHYSRLEGATTGATAMRLDRGAGVGGARDAIVTRNVWASYTHFHPLGTAALAPALVAAAARRRAEAAAWA